MRLRILIAAVAVSGGWLGACSKPAPAGPLAAENARQIRLADPAPPDSAVVSSLEANQPLKAAPVRRITRAVQARSAPAAPDRAADLAPPAPHVMSSMAEPAVVADLTPAPEARATGFGGAIGHGLGSFHAPAPGPQTLAGGGSRGPGILIRGGMGGIDDKCDIRGGHRGGTAVNRIAPAFGPRGIR